MPATIITLAGVRIDCHIVTITKVGALIAIDSVLGIPAQFTLEISGRRYSVGIARRFRRHVGVTFDVALALSQPILASPLQAASRNRACWRFQ